MPPRLPHVTTLTADYDAIERAIRETSRGRWFLAAYLERNRSAETRMLMNAIGKLERSMRDSGHVVNAMAPMETLVELRDAIGKAREDIARTRKREGSPAWLPVPRFTFDSFPADFADETRAIRAAAANLQTAAQALRGAGVFPGVAQQIGERVDDINLACDAQDTATRGMQRMATLLSELEAQIMGAIDGDEASADLPDPDEAPPYRCETASFTVCGPQRGRAIPEEVVRQLSEALAASLEDDDDDDDDDDDEEPFPDLP